MSSTATGDARLTTHEVGGDLWLIDPDESGSRGRWLMSSHYIDAGEYR